MLRTLLLKSHQTLSTIIYIIVGCLKAESKLILHPYSFYFKCLDSSTFAWLNFFFNLFGQLLWVLEHFLKKGNFLFFLFQKELFEFQERLTNCHFCAICVCVYIYCCTYSCSMRQFSWATLLVNKISFFIFGFPYSVVLVLIIVVQMGVVNITKNTTMICAPLMAQSVEQVLSNMYQAKAEGADVVEIRLDCINNFQPGKDLEIILTKKPLPVLIVYR